MKRTASAHWEGDLKNGKGNLSTQSTTLNKTQYSFNTRFADGVGTNPEELLARVVRGSQWPWPSQAQDSVAPCTQGRQAKTASNGQSAA